MQPREQLKMRKIHPRRFPLGAFTFSLSSPSTPWSSAPAGILGAQWLLLPSSIGLYGFVATIAPQTYLLHRSLRLSVLFGSLAIWLGAILRCLPLVLPSLPLKAFPYLAYIAACLTSLGGPVAMAGCLSVSANWFPPSERNFATSVGQMFNALGLGFSFVLSFLILPGEGDETSDGTANESKNGTDCSNSSLTLDDLSPASPLSSSFLLSFTSQASLQSRLATLQLKKEQTSGKGSPS